MYPHVVNVNVATVSPCNLLAKSSGENQQRIYGNPPQWAGYGVNFFFVQDLYNIYLVQEYAAVGRTCAK